MTAASLFQEHRRLLTECGRNEYRHETLSIDSLLMKPEARWVEAESCEFRFFLIYPFLKILTQSYRKLGKES